MERLLGSSPRVWGQGSFAVRFAVLIRIIPTRMGTSSISSSPSSSSRDHPHAYGDKYIATLLTDKHLGSSPRVWGQAHTYHGESTAIRIIPTRMGTRVVNNERNKRKMDHPHAYGDKAFSSDIELDEAGSSPRVWGQVGLSNSNQILKKDHPHAYGDKLPV